MGSQVLAVLSIPRLDPHSAGKFDLTPLSGDLKQNGLVGRSSCFTGDLPQARTASTRLRRDPAECDIRQAAENHVS